MVFQDPYGSLHPAPDGRPPAVEPLAIHGFDDREQRILRALDEVGLGAGVPLPLSRTSFPAASASAWRSPGR